MSRRGWAMRTLILTTRGAAAALENGWTHDAEFFVAWWFGERVAVRAGASHLVNELVTRTPPQDGNDRFRRSTTLVFAAVTLGP
ncbi:MAG TPA: hypothetical protein VFD38_19825 [Myxococcaceae bacterium]|nr:hypothetical protein [Myxococcaceae bacterium]